MPLCRVAQARAASGALRLTRLCCMRFDKAAPPSSSSASSSPRVSAASSNETTAEQCRPFAAAMDATASPSSSASAPEPPRVTYRPFPESMYPKDVPADFTPFPLPKHDDTLGFGPVRLRNVPDIEEARLRMADAPPHRSSASPSSTGARTALMDGDELSAAMLWEDLGDAAPLGDDVNAGGTEDSAALAAAPHPSSSSVAADATASAPDEQLGGYHTHPQFPLLDVLECDRSVDDLLAQFQHRPEREARTATVLDFAATLQKRSNEELTRILYELSSLFTWDGNGLQFIVTKVVKFGRGYTVSSELTKAFVTLVDAMTVTFAEEQPSRLAESPELLVQVLHFLALVKIMEPNKWFSLTANSTQNRTDYTHPRGVNLHTAHAATGQVLVGFLEDMVAAGHDIDGDADATGVSMAAGGEGLESSAAHRLTAGWSPELILDALAGFAAVMPNGQPSSRVLAALLDELWTQWSKVGFHLTTPQQADQLERLYMLLQVMDVQRDAVLDALLGGQLRTAQARAGTSSATPLFYERDDTPPLTLAPALTQVRGPDFFSAVSRDRRAEVKQMALALLAASLARARAAGDTALLQALVESGMELLMTLTDKEAARRFAQQENVDGVVLGAVSHLGGVAARLAAQDPSWSVYPLTSCVRGGLPDTQRVLRHLALHPIPYVMTFEGRRVHPVRSFFANLDYVKSMDNVFVLHSSGVETHVSSLISTVRRLRSGKDALIVTASCLRALQATTLYGRTDGIRQRAGRALQIVAYELECGRAVLLPPSEELYLHDAGVYCDEDLMLWTLAAYLARDLPLVKVHGIVSRRSPARNPHHMLTASLNTSARPDDVYNPSTPLLQSLHSKELRSLTHMPRLQTPVADRAPKLYSTNPARTRFVYRRDKALFDKYHVTARQLAPGFSQGALNSDLRGLGFYTPDHPQVPYTPVSSLKVRPVLP